MTRQIGDTTGLILHNDNDVHLLESSVVTDSIPGSPSPALL